MKKRIIRMTACCLAVLLFTGCSAANPESAVETEPESTVESIPEPTEDPVPEVADPAPEIKPEPDVEGPVPVDLSQEMIEGTIAELFEEFTDFDWKITVEDIMEERPDISKKVENLSTKTIGKIEYEMTIGGRQFAKDYSSSGTSVDSFGFSAKTSGLGSQKSGELSEEEVEQFKEAVFSQIKLLEGEIRYLTEKDMGNYNKAVHDEIYGYVAKTKYGFVSITPRESYVAIQFYSSDYGTMKKTFPNAKKM